MAIVREIIDLVLISERSDILSLTPKIEYRGMVGSLLYLIVSRPDIVFAMCLCASFQSCPKVSHVTATKRILRYLIGTTNHGLRFEKRV